MVYKQLAEIDTEPDSPPQILTTVIRERFRPVYEDNFMKLANCLDPRFADRTLDDPELCQNLKTCMKFVNPNMSEFSPPPEDLVISIDKPKSLFPKKSSYLHLGSTHFQIKNSFSVQKLNFKSKLISVQKLNFKSKLIFRSKTQFQIKNSFLDISNYLLINQFNHFLLINSIKSIQKLIYFSDHNDLISSC